MSSLTLTTERLILRGYRDEDFEGVHAYASDPEVCRHVQFGPNTPEQTRAWMETVKKWETDIPVGHYEFLVTLEGSGRVIGSCGLTQDAQMPKGEVGYCFNRMYWGQGYATEAVRAVLGFAFGPLGLHRVSAPIHDLNSASARVAVKCGMKKEGTFRKSHFLKGSWWTIDHYAVLAEEWRDHTANA